MRNKLTDEQETKNAQDIQIAQVFKVSITISYIFVL